MLDERQRMAGEIHDTLAQGLTGIITQLQAAEQAGERPGRLAPARRRRDRAGPGEPDRGPAVGARAAARAAGDGPAAARRWPSVAERWSALHGIAVQVTTTGTARPLPPEAEVALLRTAQEALANVAKHAQATRVGLTLSYMEHEVALDVRDDGAGFDPAGGEAALGSRACGPRRRRRFGLVAMRQRIEGLSGTLQVESEPGGGTGDLGAASRRAGPIRRARLRAGGPRTRAPIRLLIVDDHPVVRDGLSGMFAARPGFEVLGEAADGAEAVRLAQALRARRDPDGPADARHGRRGRDHRAGPARDPGPGAGADHLRHRQLRAARDRGGRDRLPAQGRPARRTAPRGPGRRAGPGGAVPVGGGPADEPGPRRPARSR